MRTLYHLLVITFILSNIAGILLVIFYFQAIADLFGGLGQMTIDAVPQEPDPSDLFRFFFGPKILLSFLALIITSIANTVIGIVLIAGDPSERPDAKVLWILGFIFLGFVTNIVFFALRRSDRLLVAARPQPDPSAPG